MAHGLFASTTTVYLPLACVSFVLEFRSGAKFLAMTDDTELGDLDPRSNRPVG